MADMPVRWLGISTVAGMTERSAGTILTTAAANKVRSAGWRRLNSVNWWIMVCGRPSAGKNLLRYLPMAAPELDAISI